MEKSKETTGNTQKMSVRHRNIFRIMRLHYTLVELLVTIAVIAILMAILLPSLKSAVDRASAVPCKGQLRQLGMAMVGYSATYNHMIPWMEYDPDTGEPGYTKYDGGKLSQAFLPGLNYYLTGKYPAPDAKKGNYDLNLFQCGRTPLGPTEKNKKSVRVWKSYNSISSVNWDTETDNNRFRLTQFIMPATKVAIWDGRSGINYFTGNGTCPNTYIPGAIVAGATQPTDLSQGFAKDFYNCSLTPMWKPYIPVEKYQKIFILKDIQQKTICSTAIGGRNLSVYHGEL